MKAESRDMSILYVEDDDAIRDYMHVFLKNRFERVLVAENGAAGFQMFRENAPDIVMTDIRMPIMDGLEMIRAILENNDKAAIIVTSAYDESTYLLGAIELGVSHYLLKPFDSGKVDASLRQCIDSVGKAQAIRERENSLAAAYLTINSLIDCDEEGLNGSTDLTAEKLEKQLDRMVKTIFGECPSPILHKPTSLIMTLTHGLVGEPEWLWYEMKSGRLQKGCSLYHPPPDPTDPIGNQVLYCLNEGEPLPDDQPLRRFLDSFGRYGEKPRNLVWYQNGSRVVCALNYPGRVTAYDAAVVKNLAVQTRYLDTISAQCHQTEEAFFYTITSLARAAEANDEDTGNHVLRVGKYCAAICRRIGYPAEMAEIIALQSQLHDVGKIHVPPEILKKPDKLTYVEMVLMREHPLLGARIIGNHPRLEIARNIALYHHEHWDGSGYPFGLCGSAIPMDARIVALADTYDALRNRRSYKIPFDHDTAFRIIMEGDGRSEPSHFDPHLLRNFKKINQVFDEVYQQFATVKEPLSDAVR